MKKKKIINRYVINLLLTTLFGGVVGIINYLFNIFIARFTPEEIFGLYSSAIGIIYLIQIPALTIQNVLTKSVGKSKKGNISKLKTSSLITFGLIGLALSILMYSSSSLFTENMEETVKTVFPLSITLLLAFLSPISKGILLGKEKVMTVNIMIFIETVLRFALGYLAVRLGGNLTILILANAVPAFLGCIAVIPFLRSPNSHKEKINIPYSEIILMTVSLLLLSAPYTLDLILVPSELRAEYGALSLIGKLVYFSAVTVASVMFARLSNQKDQKKDLRTVGITVFLTFLIGVVASGLLFLFKDLIIELAFGGRYSNISIYFILFGLIMTVYAVVYMLANFFFARDSYRYSLLLLAVTIVQVVLLKFWVTDLSSVVYSQVIIYTLLLILTTIYFISNFIFKQDERKNKEDI